MKTTTAHFYVQRNTMFGMNDDYSWFTGVIPFEVAPLNEGNAFDLSSGTFTVTVPGIYHFDLTAVNHESAPSLGVCILVNGGVSNGGGGGCTSIGETSTRHVISFSASFRLAASDRVNSFLNYGVVGGSNHFSGWLVEEDFM